MENGVLIGSGFDGGDLRRVGWDSIAAVHGWSEGRREKGEEKKGEGRNQKKGFPPVSSSASGLSLSLTMVPSILQLNIDTTETRKQTQRHPTQ